jgi:hypothetical protein
MMEDFGGGHLRPAPGRRFRWRSPRFARCAQQSDRGWCTAKSNLAVRAKANDVKDFLADVDATICVTRLWMRSSIRSMRFLCRELGVIAPVQPTRSPYTSSRLARASVAENCDRKSSSAYPANSGVGWFGGMAVDGRSGLPNGSRPGK